MHWAHTLCSSTMATAALLILVTTAVAGADTKDAVMTPGRNWRPDGTYRLVTNDPRSIQAYYRDVGVGPLTLPTPAQYEDMRELCLTLGKLWRPLGLVDIPGDKGGPATPMELCYYAGPNPPQIAALKCANLGLALRENRAARREIVCAPLRAGS